MTIRESYVTAKALAYAIKTIESLPVKWQEWSDAQDMKRVLHEYFPVWETLVTNDANRHIDGAKKRKEPRRLTSG
jgi:hypothetical protein